MKNILVGIIIGLAILALNFSLLHTSKEINILQKRLRVLGHRVEELTGLLQKVFDK